MRLRPYERPPTPEPSPKSVFRALELKASTTPSAAADTAVESLQSSGLLLQNPEDARAKFLEMFRDRDGDGRLELDLDAPGLADVVDVEQLRTQGTKDPLRLETTVDLEALAQAQPITLDRADTQDVIAGFMPLVLDTKTGELRALSGQLGEHESVLSKVHFAVSDGTITLRVLELPKSGDESQAPKILFRLPDDFKSYREEGLMSSPKERLSFADAALIVKQLAVTVDVSSSPRMIEAFALFDRAAQSGNVASRASTETVKAKLAESFSATPSKAWIGRQMLDLLSNPNNKPFLDQIDAKSTAVPPELVLSTMFAEGFNIHWAKRGTWAGLPNEGPVFGMDYLGLDLLGRTEALATRYETPNNRDMNLVPPPPPKGPPTLDYPTAPTFDALVELGLLPADFPIEVGRVLNLVEGQGDRIVYGVELASVPDAITAVHATLAFCQTRFIRDYDHAYGTGAHEKLSERELCYAISSYYNGGWMLGRATALRDLVPERRANFGTTNLDRAGNLSIGTNAMIRTGLYNLLIDVGAFPR